MSARDSSTLLAKLCRKHSNRLRASLTTKLQASLWDRFHAKIEPVTESGCWIWTASIRRTGYGRLGLGRRRERDADAHRIAWQLYRGDIPAGLWVLHRCDVRCCVNPEHLYLGTIKDNAKDRVLRGRQHDTRGMRSGSAKLTEDAVRHIARREMSSRKYGKLYGVGRSTIQNIWTGDTWSSVTSL
jgi:hypothetical protein